MTTLPLFRFRDAQCSNIAGKALFSTIQRLHCIVEASFATIHRLHCIVEASFATIHRLHCIVEASFATIHRLQCIGKAFSSTITYNHISKRIDFACILAILPAKEARTAAYLAVMSAKKGLNGGMLERPDARFEPNMGMKRWLCGEDVRAGGVIFIICRYCNLL